MLSARPDDWESKMTTFSMDGVVRAMRRGGWSARGVIVDVRHGQIFETQIGPREFPAEKAAREWLRDVAATRSIKAARIVLGATYR
jgi:hypothetical protein